ncbi:fumarate hydratase [bacterium]|nr:fumarate hydratase [bacterium]
MVEVSTALIKDAVFNLCINANTSLDLNVYEKIYNAYQMADNIETKNILGSVLQNAKTASEKQCPLCQDTGQVIVFINIGQDVNLTGDFIEKAVNDGVEQAYKQGYFRKSVVKDALFDRKNTSTNTPAIIYTKYNEGSDIEIGVIIKGGGSENKSLTKMLMPTLNIDEITEAIGEMILSAGVNACPPMFVGVGIGGTIDKAAIESKKVFLENDFLAQEKELAINIKEYVNAKAPKLYNNFYVLDIKIHSFATHIASMPVAISINCHSDRLSKCIIKDNKIVFFHKIPEYKNIETNTVISKEIKTEDVSSIRGLKEGENILLTGEIYVARDMVHKKFEEIINSGQELPIDIKDRIIFYAGPCPSKPGEIIGSIGPTTASRMDKYAVKLYEMGLMGTIGKGDRNSKVAETIKKNNAKYFTVTGGIAALLAEKVKKSEVIAFEDLGAEALYKLYVEKFPVRVEIG